MDPVLQAPHAVCVEALGVYWTYCGLSRRPGGIRGDKLRRRRGADSAAPGFAARGRSRLRCSWLVPDSLNALRSEVLNGLLEPEP
jgi:hypothetical protein